MLKMKENEFVKDYVDKLMKIVNQVRLLGAELSDARIVEKVLVSILERFESKIAALEESKDLTLMIVYGLVNALQVAETKRQIRLDEHIETALQTKFKDKNVCHDGNKKFQNDTRNKKKAAISNQRQQSKKLEMQCALTTKRLTMLKSIVGLGQTLSLGSVINLVMWKWYAKTKLLNKTS